LTAIALGGCGSSHTLPPAAGPPPPPVRVSGDRMAKLDTRARVLTLYGQSRTAHAPAGVGPTHLACVPRYCYVVDTRAEALLVFQTRPLTLTRRYYLPGAPGAIAVGRGRLFVALAARHEVVELPVHG